MDRLYRYLAQHDISAYAFEHTCGLSNGYLGKQLKGKGNIGSAVIEKIKMHYPDLNIHWLVTGQGSMKADVYDIPHLEEVNQLQEESKTYIHVQATLIQSLQKQIQQLEQTIADEESIIYYLEKSIQ